MNFFVRKLMSAISNFKAGAADVQYTAIPVRVSAEDLSGNELIAFVNQAEGRVSPESARRYLNTVFYTQERDSLFKLPLGLETK